MADGDLAGAVARPGKMEWLLRVAAVACWALALGLLAAHTLSWKSVGPRAPALLPPAGEVLAGTAQFRFAVVGDSHGNLDPLDAVLSGAKADGANLILHVGDLVGNCAPLDFDWFLEELEEAELAVPLCTVPGNHDGFTEESDPQLRNRLYSRSFGPRRYWFAYANALFVAFDNTGKRVEDEDLQWLDETLGRLRRQFEACFVYAHRPPIEQGSKYEPNIEHGKVELLRVLAKHRISALFAGHIHDFVEQTVEGIPVFVTGGSGGRPERPGIPFHYILCHVEPGGAFRVEKREVAVASNEEHWEERLLVVVPRYMGLRSLFVLMAAGLAFAVLGLLAERRRLRRRLNA